MAQADDRKDPDAREDHPIPLAVAIGTMGLILIVGAGLIAKYLYRPSPPSAIRTAVPSPSNPHVVGGPGAPDQTTRTAALQTAAEADLPDGVHPGPAGGVLFKAGDAYLKVLADGDDVRPSFGFFTLSDREWQHGYLTQGVRRLTADPDFARELALTDDQRKRLSALPDPPPARWSDADRQRFLTLYHQWHSADDKAKAPAAAQLVEALNTYATQRRAIQQQAMEQRITGIRAILTEPQLARINPIPRWDLPATRPAPPK